MSDNTRREPKSQKQRGLLQLEITVPLLGHNPRGLDWAMMLHSGTNKHIPNWCSDPAAISTGFDEGLLWLNQLYSEELEALSADGLSVNTIRISVKTRATVIIRRIWKIYDVLRWIRLPWPSRSWLLYANINVGPLKAARSEIDIGFETETNSEVWQHICWVLNTPY